MKIHMLMLSLLIFCGVVACSANSDNQPQHSTPTESQQDIEQRLEQAEQRIQELEAGESSRCEHCNGTGRLTCGWCEGDGEMDSFSGDSYRCERCSGKGWIECGYCGGDGKK